MPGAPRGICLGFTPTYWVVLWNTLKERGSQASVGLVTQRHRCQTARHNFRPRSWDLSGTSVLLPPPPDILFFFLPPADLKLSSVNEAGLELLILLPPPPEY